MSEFRSVLQEGQSIMKLSIKNPTQCFYCGRQLSVVHRLIHSMYCGNSHRSAHSREVNRLALARLLPEPETRRPQCERRLNVEDLRQSA
jgi:hypothetical protein